MSIFGNLFPSGNNKKGGVTVTEDVFLATGKLTEVNEGVAFKCTLDGELYSYSSSKLFPSDLETLLSVCQVSERRELESLIESGNAPLFNLQVTFYKGKRGEKCIDIAQIFDPHKKGWYDVDTQKFFNNSLKKSGNITGWYKGTDGNLGLEFTVDDGRVNQVIPSETLEEMAKYVKLTLSEFKHQVMVEENYDNLNFPLLITEHGPLLIYGFYGDSDVFHSFYKAPVVATALSQTPAPLDLSDPNTQALIAEIVRQALQQKPNP